MALGEPGKLTLAIVGSASLHVALLIGVQAPSGLQISTPRPQAFLSARLMAASAPLPTVPAEPVVTPLTHEPAPETSPSEPLILRRYDDASPRQLDVGISQRASPQAMSRTPPPQSSGEQDGQNRPGVRVAKPEEVKVRVIKYAKDAEDNPNEIMESATGKYVYFNAPQLKQSAHPVADIKPHYPLTKLEYPHGAVSLLLQIDEEGKLEKTSVICANPIFQNSAIASIKEMRFVPAIGANGPAKSYMIVEFSYGVGSPCGPLPATLQMELSQRPR